MKIKGFLKFLSNSNCKEISKNLIIYYYTTKSPVGWFLLRYKIILNNLKGEVMKETHNEELEKKNINVKLFPFYKMISWDLLFFYAIIFL